LSARDLCLLVLATTVACSTPDRDNPHDQRACDPGCESKQICFQGQCIDDPCPKGGMIYVSETWEDASDMAFCVMDHEVTEGASKGTVDWKGGELPLDELFAEEAYAACRAAGALLCTRSQWAQACRGAGTEDGGDNRPALEDCNLGSNGPARTGSHQRCEGGYTGIFDILGNVAEYVMDDYRGRDGVEGQSAYGVEGLLGGAYGDKNPSCDGTPALPEGDQLKGAGLRCCVPCDASGGNCKASPLWFQYPLRDPGNGYREVSNPNTFDRLWGSAESDVWAVYSGGLAHFDGKIWALDAALSKVLGSASDDVTCVWGTSAKDVWAAVERQLTGHGALYHHDGDKWSLAQDLSADKASINDMHGAKDDIWAVGADESGHGLVYHYDGKAWTREVHATLPSKIMELNAVWSHAGEVWAVGDDGKVLHRDAQGDWSLDPIKDPKGLDIELLDIDGLSASAIWAAGRGRTSSGTGPVAFRWDGSEWGWVIEPDFSKITPGTSSELESVHAVSASDVWASGSAAYRWDGKNWSKQTDKVDGPVWVGPQGDVFVGFFRRF
jgi:hypothetical protein